MASSINLKEFKFFVSVRVPNVFSPRGRIETFTSKRIEPSAMWPSQMPIEVTSPCNFFANRTASEEFEISGSVTISINAVPARFRSIPEQCLSKLPLWRDFPASSSKWAW